MWVAGRLGVSAMMDMTRNSLRRGQMVKVSRLGGWMSLGQILMWVVRTKEFPGGIWFAPMALTLLSGTLANVLIAAYTTGVAVSSICGGQILMATANASVNWTDAQSALLPSYANALQAQIYSMANGGLPGVYRAAPVDPMFRATENDVAGSWDCVSTWSSTRVSNTNYSASQAQAQASAGGANTSSSCGYFPNGVNQNCIGVGTDFNDADNLRLLLSVDVPFPNNTFTDTIGLTDTVDGYTCTLKAAPSYQWVRSRVAAPQFTYSLAAAITARVVYDRDIMRSVVQLISNSLLAVNTYAPSGSAVYTDGAAYGCVTVGTRVQLPACVPLCMCIVSLFAWLIASTITKVVVYGSGPKYKCPINLLGWMDQAIREAGADVFGDTRITAERRRDWVLAIYPNPEGGPPRVGLLDQRNHCRVTTDQSLTRDEA
jgi:hypothetical protein